ncbi:uncharacterized protein F5147DRAFT_725463 [Suillus discolor]|uniref:Uncharacterized protein n=1 Tax=Suillus discolor TaxID=1912936 RepID=A0A9P7JMX3_9AGAM|nr:uncharacterized protein F5147DRAFT_725463 [Suillus discolor]KAG2089858.1 hypothetical protein F5147DRAFT_725463 [Suillus discolor]
MSESMFGSPSHLLSPDFASESVQAGNGARMPAPVHQPPPSFTDIQFGTIGKPPNLLSRISEPDPGQMSFRSPSPATLHLPPPVPTRASFPNSRKLAERIQMGPSQLNSSAKSQNLHLTRELPPAPRINRNRYVPANPHLIPPIEVLPTTSESNVSQMQAPTNANVNKVREALTPELVYPGSSLVTPTTEQPNRDILSSSVASGSPQPNSSVGFFPHATLSPPSSTLSAPLSPNSKMTGTSSNQVPDVVQPEASQEQIAQDSLSTLCARLLEKSKTLSLALPTSLIRTPSPSVPPSNVPELAAGPRNETNAEELGAIVLRHPYPHNTCNSKGSLDREISPADDGNALTLTSSRSSNIASRNTRIESLVEVIKNLKSVADDAVKLQLDANQVFEAERIDFDERRRAFEERMLTRDAEYEAQMKTLQKKLEELGTREERLVALEEESRLREERRCARDAQRRARDDQRRFEDELRRTATQEEIDEAMKLLQEVKAEKTQWEAERERAEREKTLAQNNAALLQLSADIEPPVEKEDGMTEEEIKAVDDYKKALSSRLRLTENLKKQIAWTRQSFDALQHMKQKRLQADEAERQQVEEDAQRRRIQAEETAKSADEEQKMGRGDLLAQRSQHPEAQSQNTQPDVQAEFNRLRAQVLANKQQATSENAARIRAERAEHLAVSTIDGDGLKDMNVEVEVDELASPLDHTVPLPGQQDITPKKAASRTKKTPRFQGTSGMLGAPPNSDGPPSSLMSTPASSSSSTVSASYKTPSFVSASTDIGRQVITDAPLFSTQLASEFSLDLSISPLPNGPPPTSKKIALPSTPKSRTILASDGNEWTEWTVGQQANFSPAQREANLRHIKKNRHRVEESATGDRSVKRPDDSLPIKTIKTEEVVVEESHNQERTSSLLEEGTSARSTTNAMVHVSNDNPPSGQAKISASQANGVPQTSIELVVGQAPSASLRSDARDGSAGTSGSVTGLVPIRNSPGPWIMDASVVRQEWTPDAISPHSEPSESASRHDPNQRSRQNSQISRRTRSPEPSGFTRSNGTSGESRSQRQRRAPRYPDHYSPPPASATSSHHRHLEQNETAAYGLSIPPRPMSPMNSGRKRLAEHDNEYDNRDRRRPRGDHYVPERDYRNSRGLARHSPDTETEWRRGRSTSPELRSSIHDRLRSPSPSRQIRPHTERDTFDRRGRNEGSHRPDYTNTADVRRPSDSGYSMEERPARREERGDLLGRISVSGGRGNINRGRGRGKGDVGRGRGGAGGRRQPLSSRPLEERIAK